MTLRLLPTATATLGRETGGFVPRESYGVSRHGPVDLPTSQLERTAFHAQTVLGTGSVNGGTSTVTSAERLLTPEQARLIYQRTPDVRAAIDGIVRRVATADWTVSPSDDCDPAHERYDEAAEEAKQVATWLKTPTEDLDLFQEVFTATLTDLLVWDAGALELVGQKRKPTRLEELVSMRGADVHPRVDAKGRLLDYVQEPRTALSGAATRVVLGTEQVLYFRLFPNNEGPEGLSLLESLIYEVAAILRAAEHVCSAFNLNELPPGLLVVTGLAKGAQDRFRADFEARRGQDWQMRPLFSEASGVVSAEWIELQHAPRELQIAELATQIQRTIWRVFGVMPIEMGDPVDSNRATATVQLDVGSSHLLTPILDLIEAKLTTRVVPRRLTDPSLAGLVAFRWKRTRDLSPDEQKARAEALKVLVEAGLLSTNEARHQIGQAARDEGDVLRVGLVTLASIVVPPEEDEDGVEEDAEGSDESRDDESDTAADDEKDKEEKKKEEKSRRRKHRQRARAARETRALAQRSRPRVKPGHMSERAEEMPSDWQSPGRFDDTRTLDLVGMWDEVSGYGVEAEALWEEARTAVLSVVASHYRTQGFDAALRQRVSEIVRDEVERLYVAWSVDTGPRYESVATSASRQASRFTGLAVETTQARARAALYHQLAMGYLLAEDGLLTDLRSRVAEVLVAVTDIRGTEPPPSRAVLQRAPLISPEASTEAVLLAVAAAFDALKHRIQNWSGKLLDLAYGVLVDEVQAGSTSGRAEGISDPVPGDPVEWWCCWVAVGDDGTCGTCRAEAGKGFQPLAGLRIRPGAGTTCRSRCRCGLCLWTKAEVDSGRADDLNLK